MPTKEQKRKIGIAYLACGNSVEDLVSLLIEALHSGSEDPYDAFYETIKSELSGDNGFTEKDLEEIYNDSRDSYNICCWG